MIEQQMIEEINRLKKEKNAIILAHNYQIPAIQEIADFVGDSLALAKVGKESTADIIVLCGVKFMAETAKILSPEKTILLPNKEAGCPMADMVTEKTLNRYKEEHPNAYVVAYVNTSAEVKALSDICITSSNAFKIFEQLEAKEILILPDQNLGGYIKSKFPDKNIDLWRGFCCTHEFLSEDDILRIKKQHKHVKVLMHPECNPKTLQHADFIGSTYHIIQYARQSEDQEFIIATEEGIIHQLKKDNPNRKYHLASPKLICKNMKKTVLEDLYHALNNNTYEINLSDEIIQKAYSALDRMLALS